MSSRIVTVEELKKHNKASDCWIAVHGRVFDVTKFLPDHPGGGEVISALAGCEVTSEFEDIGHSDSSRREAKDYFVGWLEGGEESGGESIPLLKDLQKQPLPGLDTRLVVSSCALVVAAAVAGYYYLSNKK